MAQKEILYAAYKNEKIEDGLAYAIYLAELLGNSLRVVLFEPKGLREKFEDIMTAITFAEADEEETARQVLMESEHTEDVAAVHAFLKQKCDEAGISVNIHTGFSDIVSVVKVFLKKRNIDMVLLSPALTKSGSVLKQLTKASPRPVVTMAY